RCRQRLDLAGAEKRRRIGLRPLLQHAKDHVGAGRLRQAAELFERPLGFEPPGTSSDQPDERRALTRHPCRPFRPLLRHACMSSPSIAPALTRTGGPLVVSTIVDGAPPGVRPMSINRSIRAPSVRSPSAGSAVAGAPLRFALVAVIGQPTARQMARVTSQRGTRTPTLPVP